MKSNSLVWWLLAIVAAYLHGQSLFIGCFQEKEKTQSILYLGGKKEQKPLQLAGQFSLIMMTITMKITDVLSSTVRILNML